MWRYCPYIERVLGGIEVKVEECFDCYKALPFNNQCQCDTEKLQKEIDLLNNTIDHLKNTNDKLLNCVKEVAKPNNERTAKGPRMGDALKCLKEIDNKQPPS